MIIERQGNLLEADVDVLVNTVNTVGIMGKGIALQFRRAYPQMFADYQRAAKRGEIRLGSMHVWETGQLDGPRFVVNFPTKGHWRSGSRLSDIERGLDDLVRVLGELDVASVAVPPLGCGHGGLAWGDVEPLIRSKLAALDLRVELFGPGGAPAARDMVDGSVKKPLTRGRAALVELIGRYSPLAEGSTSLVETQKLMYFLQEVGEPLKLRYIAHTYGPYADNLRPVLQTVEGHYLSGYGDGSARVMEAEPLSVLPGARDAATAVLDAHPDTRGRIDQVMSLVDGFESAYSLELLATTHWVATRHCADDPSVECVIREVQDWSPRKGRMFGDRHIAIALDALRERGWLPD
ncbi:MAG: type II toxin-antitoxin system antitoxin DNA ADP-ribosyl glycohydrolase DarG [Dermatophilaceae bacterium]